MTLANSDNTTNTSIVSVRNRQLFTETGERFFLRGLAFPTPQDPNYYNESAWIQVLHQIKDTLQLDINTIRVYRMDPFTNYSGFFRAAQELGLYVIVPLTAGDGAGNLDRTVAAPKCYNATLFHYGVACLNNYLQYPNALAGVVGNEVMNNIKTWRSAPCVKAYGRDLQTYLQQHFVSRPFPLLYTAQDSGIGAAVTNVDAMRLTANYLSCRDDDKDDDDTSEVAGEGMEISPIDIFGINVESWCSSIASFRYNDDGTIGSYYKLYQALYNVSTALVLSEMGCPQSYFNRDNGVPDKTRSWNQISVVKGNMSDTWSGFCAYAYSGSPDFDMTKGGAWSGGDIRVPKPEMANFRDQLLASQNISLLNDSRPSFVQPLCTNVMAEMESFGLFTDSHALYNVSRIPNYALKKESFLPHGMTSLVCGGLFLWMVVSWVQTWKRSAARRQTGGESKPLMNSNVASNRFGYNT